VCRCGGPKVDRGDAVGRGQRGELAEPALRKALVGMPSVELSQRLETLLDKLSGWNWSGERLRLWRAIQVLEGVGTADADPVEE